jgi:hypothetical protein
MEIAIDRRAAVPENKPVQFAVTVASLDVHTHGELTCADRRAITGALLIAADAIEAILKKQAEKCGSSIVGKEPQP